VPDEKAAMLDAYELFKTTDCTAEEAVAKTPGCVCQADSLVRKLRRENQVAAAGGEQGRGDHSAPSTSNVGAKRQASAPSSSILTKYQRRAQFQRQHDKENQPHPGSGVPLNGYRLNHSQRGAQMLQQATTSKKQQSSRVQATEQYVPVLRRLVFSVPCTLPSWCALVQFPLRIVVCGNARVRHKYLPFETFSCTTRRFQPCTFHTSATA